MPKLDVALSIALGLWLASGELGGAVLLAALALFAPWVALGTAVAIFWLTVRILRKISKRA